MAAAGPLRLGMRHGHEVIVNRQLCVANAFEQVLEERTPRFHRALRNFFPDFGQDCPGGDEDAVQWQQQERQAGERILIDLDAPDDALIPSSEPGLRPAAGTFPGGLRPRTYTTTSTICARWPPEGLPWRCPERHSGESADFDLSPMYCTAILSSGCTSVRYSTARKNHSSGFMR